MFTNFMYIIMFMTIARTSNVLQVYCSAETFQTFQTFHPAHESLEVKHQLDILD
jgi:hypothetical protein